jgi:Flp pilus assembly pilin Flp
MTLTVAISLYAVLVAFVTSLMIYYFQVIRPKDEEQLK